jgi:hypothetical protein
MAYIPIYISRESDHFFLIILLNTWIRLIPYGQTRVNSITNKSCGWSTLSLKKLYSLVSRPGSTGLIRVQ